MVRCVAKEAAPNGSLVDVGSAPARCTSLVYDAERVVPFVGLAALSPVLASAALVGLELRNVPLDGHSLRWLAATLGCRAGDSALELLALHNNGLQAADMGALTSLLESVPTLRGLRLHGNGVGDGGARTLAAWLRGGSGGSGGGDTAALAALQLSDAQLSSTGARELIDAVASGRAGPALGDGTRARRAACAFNLSLGGNRLGPSAALLPGVGGGGAGRLAALRPGRARWRRDLALGLADAQLGDAGARRLAAGLRRLHQRAALRAGESGGSVTALDLRGNAVRNCGDRARSGLAGRHAHTERGRARAHARAHPQREGERERARAF